MLKINLLFLLIASYSSTSCCFQVIQDKIEAIVPPDSQYIEYVRPVLKNAGTKDATFTSHMKIKKELPEDATVKIEAEVLKDGKYSPFGMPITLNLCEFTKTEKKLMPTFIKHSNFPHTCPYLPGEYTLTDYKLNTSNIAFPIPPGTYKIGFYAMFGGETVGHIWYGKVLDD